MVPGTDLTSYRKPELEGNVPKKSQNVQKMVQVGNLAYFTHNLYILYVYTLYILTIYIYMWLSIRISNMYDI